MKKVLIVTASKRRKGNSYALAERVAGQLEGRAEVERFDIGEGDVRCCLACDACKRKSTPNCIQKDDFTALIPAIDQSEHLGKLAFLPAFIGVWAGFLFLLALDQFIPHLHLNSDCPEGTPCDLGKSTMMVLAVALHNLPEGMAVGVVIAGWLTGNDTISFAGVLALSLGIALQNLPEGAIISMPLRSNGMSAGRAFGYGVVSGIIEPIGAVLTILLARWLVPVLPYLLSFSAGAMLYVVVEELIPEMSEGEHSNIGTIFFAVGFTLMMMLDVALG